ncbi:MAG: HEAT repeat domain-containing protein, partial [Phycisphaeraceae bacterium]
MQTFAEGLNIPIGVLPTHDGVLAHSIPNVYRFADTTGDGQADERTTLLTGVGYEDTHGMTNSFTHWVDGWVYAQHGFRNTSMIEDRAGNKLPLQSGNAYRFRPDGHGLEQWSHGQVNPFGLAFDPLGNLYSADCHTRPVYMLLRGAYYPSFGQPHDGLGFGPEMIDHYHGSTGIAGIIYYEATQFPPQYRDCLYVGNVVTRRIHRDRLEQHGSTYLTDTQEEFLTSDDPWFRPVDVHLGPDGALYILDFYNAIIGHYEVPLDHPDRDHFRGRIWRIVYTGTDEVKPEHNAHAGQFDLTTHDADELVADLGSPNLTVRTFATHQLVERIGSDAAQPVRRIMTPRSIPAQRAHGLWVLHRLGELDDALVTQLADDEERIVRVHLMKALGEREGWSDSVGEIVRAATEDTDPFVRRAAADALGRHPAEANVMPLLNLWKNAPAEDTHLIHQTRISLRDQMLEPAIARAMMGHALSNEHRARLAEVAVAAPHPAAASFVLQYVEGTQGIAGDQLDAYLRFAANNLPLDRIDVLARLMRERFSDEPAFQLSVLRSIQQGLATQGVEPTSELRDWASEVVSVTLDRHAGQAWTNHAAPDFPDSPSPWATEERPSSDGQTARLLSSLPLGEQRTGVLRSHAIELPAEITFYMAGHNGPTSEEAVVKNFIRLRHAETNEVLAESLPPRHDTAQPYKWDLQGYEGEPAFIEITDADDASGYAWLAVGRFDPPLVKVPDVGPGEQMARQETAFQLAAVFGLHEVVDLVAAHFADAHLPVASRRVAGETLTRIDPAAAVAPLA